MLEKDAPQVAEMAAELSAHEGVPPPPFDAEKIMRFGFGSERYFEGLVVELAGQTVAYALYHTSFHVGRGTPGLFMLDLFVRPHARRQGIAWALMKKLGEICRERGGDWITWQAAANNVDALSFYEALGARRYRAADFELLVD